MMGLLQNPMADAVPESLGQSIPRDTNHAISVSLPTLRSNIGYEEGEDWVVKKMQTGYPRFFIHKIIQNLASIICAKYGSSHEKAMLFPTHNGAIRCVQFIKSINGPAAVQGLRIVDFMPDMQEGEEPPVAMLELSAVLYTEPHAAAAKAFWQHTGEGVSSRRAEHYTKMLETGLLVPRPANGVSQRSPKGPKRYRKNVSNHPNGTIPTGEEKNPLDRIQFLEERFGRNLNLNMASLSKQAIKRRIAGCLTSPSTSSEVLVEQPEQCSMRKVPGLSSADVYLYPCGMNAIWHMHDTLLQARGNKLKSICFGFPYIDTLKCLEKFGPGCLFYGFGSPEELDELEKVLKEGQRFLALFCETPSNPLLHTPDLQRIRSLADQYDFAVVIDETVGNYLNTHVLPYADVVVSSLTKVFSGDSNVSGGSAILNPTSRYYRLMRDTLDATYDDCYWSEDAIFMERNSRDFVSRIKRIDVNAEAICDLLASHPRIKKVYYPKIVASRKFYDHVKTPDGGYGGLLSATFHTSEEMAAFYDNLDTAKGPSLGTNFTLTSPFVILAHYTELDWAASFGVESRLIRFSVGLEDVDTLIATFKVALSAMEKVSI